MKFLILIIPFLTFSQEQIAKVLVLDSETKAPIPYVNISILESQISTSSNEDGSYQIEILKEDIDKNIKLSSLGYKDSIISVLKFTKLKVINLKPLIEQLNEIVITKKCEELFFTVNPIRKRDIKSGFATSNNPWKIALFFPYKKSYKSTKYLNGIKLYLMQHILIKSHPSKFRIRLFSIKENGFPGKDLISESIIVETEKRQKEVNIDLSNYNISFPEEGFYIAFEWLHIPFNWYEETITFENKKGKQIQERYAPTFSAIYSEIETFKVVHFSSGKWWNYPISSLKKNKEIVPAISLILSN